MTDLRRIRAVTDNFFFWQGLRWVPFGVALIAFSAGMDPSMPIPKGLRPWFGVPFMLLAMWLSTSVLGQYYARTFGRVRTDPSRHTLRTSVKWLIVYPAIALAMVVDAKWQPPVYVSALVFAAAIEAYRESTGGGRLHYIVASISLLALGILPLMRQMPTGRPSLSLVTAILGAIYVIGGLLDHRELVRTLSPSDDDRDVSPV
jgi:hypothetical protein